jgi:hypothetical protein
MPVGIHSAAIGPDNWECVIPEAAVAPDTVRVVVAELPFGVSVAGLALQVAEDDGENEQEKLI